jgi:hypothetical protein
MWRDLKNYIFANQCVEERNGMKRVELDSLGSYFLPFFFIVLLSCCLHASSKVYEMLCKNTFK